MARRQTTLAPPLPPQHLTLPRDSPNDLPWIIALLGMVTLLAVFRPLSEPDEGRYGEVAREIVATGDWLLPRQSGQIYPDKPPGAYWAMATFVALLGPSAFAVRLPALLAFLGTILLLRNFERRNSRRFSSPLLLAASPLLLVLSQLATLDMLLCFFTTSAILDLHRSRFTSPPWLSCRAGLALGLGFLVKGPVAWLLPLVIYGSSRLLRSASHPNAGISWLSLLSVMFLVGIPWYWIAGAMHPELWDFWLGREIIDRISSGTHGRTQPVWFFFALILVASLPWSLGVFWQRPRLNSLEQKFGFLWTWIPVLLFTLSSSKQPAYLAPAIPGLAIWLSQVWNGPARTRSRHILASAWLCFLFLGALWHLPAKNTRSDDPVSQVLKSIGADSWAGAQWNGWSYGLCFRLQRLDLRSFGGSPKAWHFSQSLGQSRGISNPKEARQAAQRFIAQDSPAFLLLHGKRAEAMMNQLAKRTDVYLAWRGERNILILNRATPGTTVVANQKPPATQKTQD